MEVLDFPDNAQFLFQFSMKTLILPPLIKTSFGKWRSPVAHLYGVQGVASSNLVFPTMPAKALRATAGFFISSYLFVAVIFVGRGQTKNFEHCPVLLTTQHACNAQNNGQFL
jgi:hypothetical protein